MIFLCQVLRGPYPLKVVHALSLHLAARHVHKATPFGSKVLESNTLHCKPIFDSFLKKSFKEAPITDGGCASKTWIFFNGCKNLRVQHPLEVKI